MQGILISSLFHIIQNIVLYNYALDKIILDCANMVSPTILVFVRLRLVSNWNNILKYMGIYWNILNLYWNIWVYIGIYRNKPSSRHWDSRAQVPGGGRGRLLGRASRRCRGPHVLGPLVRSLRLPALPFSHRCPLHGSVAWSTWAAVGFSLLGWLAVWRPLRLTWPTASHFQSRGGIGCSHWPTAPPGPDCRLQHPACPALPVHSHPASGHLPVPQPSPTLWTPAPELAAQTFTTSLAWLALPWPARWGSCQPWPSGARYTGWRGTERAATTWPLSLARYHGCRRGGLVWPPVLPGARVPQLWPDTGAWLEQQNHIDLPCGLPPRGHAARACPSTMVPGPPSATLHGLWP